MANSQVAARARTFTPTSTGAALNPQQRVARIVMLGSTLETDLREPSAAEISIARRNSVGLAYASHFPAAQELAKQESARLETFWTTMRETSALLAAHAIPHLYIKFRKLYPYYDSNVDVIVAQANWRATIDALEHEGYSGHVMFKEPDKIMFARPGQTVSVHLHPGVTWNGVPYFDLDDLWRVSLPSSEGAWRELPSEWNYLVHLAHDIFENYEISLGDILYFRRFQHCMHIDVDLLANMAAKNGWEQGFRLIYALVADLVQAWDHARQTREVTPLLVAYPYRIPARLLATAFRERIAYNWAAGRFHTALHESYAYPAFWALKRRHDLPLLSGHDVA